MQQSIFPLIFSLLLTQRLIRFSKINDNQPWVKLFTYAKYFSIFLFFAGFALSNLFGTQWIWNIFMISCLLFAFKQNEMRHLRMFLMAFVPYVAAVLINNSAAIIVKDFHVRMNSYFDTAIMLSVIWLVAILFSQYRQNKAAEKERIKQIGRAHV